MSAAFRCPSGEQIEASESWVLDDQIADVIRWLDKPENSKQVRGSTLDFGLESRLGNGIFVQGEAVPLEFMQRLCELGITLWLSIYPRPPISENPISD